MSECVCNEWQNTEKLTKLGKITKERAKSCRRSALSAGKSVSREPSGLRSLNDLHTGDPDQMIDS